MISGKMINKNGKIKMLPFDKRKLFKPKNLKKECDDLRREIIYKRAGYVSEYSGKIGKRMGGEYILQDHHPVGKANNRLRYELENGICLTRHEHNFIAHNQNHAEEFRDFVLRKKGNDFFDRMAILKNQKSPSLFLVKIYLQQELEKLEG